MSESSVITIQRCLTILSRRLAPHPFLHVFLSLSLLFPPPFFRFHSLPPRGSQSDACRVDSVRPDCFDFNACDLEACPCVFVHFVWGVALMRLLVLKQLSNCSKELLMRLLPSFAESQQSCWTDCPLTAPGMDITWIIVRAAIDLRIWYCFSTEHYSSGVLCNLTQCGCTCMTIVHNLCIVCNCGIKGCLFEKFIPCWEFGFLNMIHRGHASSEKAAHLSWRHKLLHWIHFVEFAHRHWGKCEF